MREKMTKRQRGVCVGCFIAYLGAYLIRLNLSAALPEITRAFALTGAQSGLLQTLFAVTYAAGQMINGAIADRVSARGFIFVGLSASCLCNLLFSLAASYWQLAVLWCLNGVAQAMLWTPIVKLIALWFEGKTRSRVSFAISLTMVVGHLGAWAASGYLADALGWRLSFRVPALVVFGMNLLAFCLIRDRAATTLQTEQSAGAAPMSALMRTGLIAMLLCCVANGFVRDGVVTWAPTILRESGAGALPPTAVTLLIPLLNVAGVLIGKLCLTRLKEKTRVAIAGMTAASTLVAVCLALAGAGSPLVCALLLGLLCAALYGVNPLITSLFPMEYDKMKRVALVAGMIDCFIYIGSALAGVATGAMRASFGWNAVFAVWAGASVFGTGMAALSHWRNRRA